jgi:hypothetical protein
MNATQSSQTNSLLYKLGHYSAVGTALLFCCSLPGTAGMEISGMGMTADPLSGCLVEIDFQGDKLGGDIMFPAFG